MTSFVRAEGEIQVALTSVCKFEQCANCAAPRMISHQLRSTHWSHSPAPHPRKTHAPRASPFLLSLLNARRRRRRRINSNRSSLSTACYYCRVVTIVFSSGMPITITMIRSLPPRGRRRCRLESTKVSRATQRQLSASQNDPQLL